MMKKKKNVFVIVLIVVALGAFALGYLSKQPQKFDSCKSAYDNLVGSDLCKGKFEEYWGTNDVIGNVKYFDFNWWITGGAPGGSVGGINRDCYNQAQQQFIVTGERKNLIGCFTNQIEIENSSLKIQCGCFFG